MEESDRPVPEGGVVIHVIPLADVVAGESCRVGSILGIDWIIRRLSRRFQFGAA